MINGVVAGAAALAMLFAPSLTKAMTFSGTFTNSGTIAPDSGVYLTMPVSGVYLLRFEFDSEVDASFAHHFERHYNIYDKRTGAYLAGNDTFGDMNVNFFDTFDGRFIFKLQRDSVRYDPFWDGVRYEYFEHGIQFWAAAPGKTVNYIARIDRLADVPEPSTWALLIAGFGLTGAALRRAAASTPADAPMDGHANSSPLVASPR